MIKDRLTEAIEANLENIKKGDDHIPIGMRGELEVIVKDRDGNIKSYERDHNQVTKLAKMALLHLLAGEVGTVDSEIFSVPESNNDLRRAYKLSDSKGDIYKKICSGFNPDNHSASEFRNLDGQLVSGQPYFYDGNTIDNGERTTLLSQVYPTPVNAQTGDRLQFNFPTKMLFGTGLEDKNGTDVETTYSNDFGATVTPGAIAVLNGYSSGTSDLSIMFKGCSSAADSEYGISQQKKLSNWYSANAYRCRTLQPASTDPMKTLPTANDTAIKGAIKNCFIEESAYDASLYNPTTKMALAPYRGFGYPCYIYALRSTRSFYHDNEGNREVYYGVNTTLGGDSASYETEVTYTVVMPAQPVASDSITTFYPYNGWVLRQAGLFCDSRFQIRSVDDTVTTGAPALSEAAFLNDVNSSVASDSDNAHNYRDSVGGQMLFTRNLSSPILKTADDEVTFIWHIFITV